MATPPTRVLTASPATNWNNPTTPKTTGTFDVTSGDLITIVALVGDSSGTCTTPTATGGTITWTLQQSQAGVANFGSAYVWTGAVGATATGITVSVASVGAINYGFSLSLWRNHGGVGTSGIAHAATGNPAVAITCSANSALYCGNTDWNAVAGARTYNLINGLAMVEESYGTLAVNETSMTFYSLDVGAAGAQTAGMSAPTGQAWITLGVEVLGVAGQTRTPADPEGFTDSLTATADAVRALADPEGFTDSLTATRDAVRTPADPEGFTDSLTATRDAVRTPADPEGFTDSLTATRDAVRTPADPEGFTDSLAAANDAVRTPADALGATDALSVTRSADRTPADSAGWTDGITAATDAARTPADSLGMADSLAVQWDRAGTVADSLGLTDTAAGVAAGEGVLADPLGLADDLATAADRVRNVADSLGFTDSVTDVSDAARSQADPLGLADTVTEANANSRAGTDAAGLTDSLSASFELVRSPADPVGFSDSLSVIWSRSVTLGDSLGLADAATPSGSAIGLRDLTLGAYPLHDRFALESLLPRFELGHLEDRFMSVSLAGRWSVARLEGEAMRKEVLVSAGAVEYVGGTVTELTGKDISGATFMMSLGGPANPGAWVAPSVSTAGGTPASRVLKLLVNSASPKGTFYAWARVTDAPEVAPVRFPQEIIVR